jgi:hypothetical protein
LIAPFSGTPCLWFEIKATETWKEGNNQTRSKELYKEKRAAQFSIDDGSGPVGVDASAGGDFEPKRSKSQTQSPSIMGALTGTELVFGNFRLQTPGLTLGSGSSYRVDEEILPVEPQLYACGKVADGGGAIAAPGWRSLIVSNQTRDALLEHATKTAKIGMFGGGGAVLAGVAFTVIASLFATPAASTAELSAASAPAAAPTTPATPPPAASSAAPATAGGPYALKDKVNVEWKGSVYPAQIIAVVGKDKYKIHYDGFAASWDEVVGPDRIKGRR